MQAIIARVLQSTTKYRANVWVICDFHSIYDSRENGSVISICSYTWDSLLQLPLPFLFDFLIFFFWGDGASVHRLQRTRNNSLASHANVLRLRHSPLFKCKSFNNSRFFRFYNKCCFFYFGTKSYPVQCEHSFNVLCFRALIFGALREFLWLHSLSSSGPITFSTNQCTRLRHLHTRSPLVSFLTQMQKTNRGITK